MKLTRKAIMIISAILIAAGLYALYEIKTSMPFEQRKPAVNDMAPEIALSDLSGKMVRLSDFKGKVVLVNFWASWCPPCTNEMKWFQRIYMASEEKGFAVIGIATDDVSQSKIKEMGIIYPVVIANERVKKAYGDISHVPVSFLIGRDGRIIKKLRKVYPEDELINDVENALRTSE